VSVEIGQKFNRWTVIGGKLPEQPRKVSCRCECGTERAVTASTLVNGTSKSCGCHNREAAADRARHRVRHPVEAGDTFSRLTVLDATDRMAVRCRCLCGSECTVTASNLVSGASKSCGCLRRDVNSATPKALRHGLSYHPLYHVWQQMMYRCTNPSAKDWPHYGGRGIHVHPPWHDLSTFIQEIMATLGPKPYGYTIDRINNDGNYEPGNVRWATRAEQNDNKRAPNGWKAIT
jgi:hypothetical protein